MKAYPEYKPSGIDWLGEIPRHWGLTKLKYYSEIFSGKPSLEISKSVSEILKYPVYGGGNILGYSSEYNCDANTIVLGRVGGDGYARLINTKFWATDNSLIINTLLNNSYLVNLLNVAELLRLNTSTAQPLLTASKIGNLILSVPPKDEQVAIAAYLDDMTGKVDMLIAEKQKQVENLRAYRTSLITETVTRGLNPEVPLRNSGIDWLGDIPQHWSLTKTKYYIDIKSGDPISKDEISSNGQYPVFGGGEIIGYTDSTNIKKDTIIIGRVGARCGCVRIAVTDSWATDNALVLQTDQHPQYLYLLLEAANLNRLNESNAQPLITATKVKDLKIPLPPLSEQKEIYDFLDEKILKIDALIDALTKQLDELAEYKRAVISEAVTGKVDVRDWKPNN